MNNLHSSMNEITPQAKASFKSRLIVAIFLVLILVPTFFFGGWIYFAVIGVLLVFSTYEMIHVIKKSYPVYVQVLTYVVVLCYVYWFVIKVNLNAFFAAKSNNATYIFSLENYFSVLNVSIIGIACSLFLYGIIAIFDKRFTWDDVAYFFTFTLILALGFQGFFFCRYYPSYLFGTHPGFNEKIWYFGVSGQKMVQASLWSDPKGYALWHLSSASLILFVITGTCANDVFAYVVGSLFGKHKMNERISPHKTWEGFFGGYLAGVIVCLAIGLGLAFGGYPMLPTLDAGHWYWILLLSLLIPLAGDVGDLFFSLIKRHYGVKDYGSILKGHGGIVDRIGSDMFAALTVSIILIFITNGWNFLI